MTPSFRKKLRKGQAVSEKTIANNSDSHPSFTNSNEDCETVLTLRPKAHEPIASENLSPTPPPPLSQSPRRQTYRDISPPQTLFDRYTKRGARLVTTTVQATSTHSARVTENKAVDENLSVLPTDTRTVGGIQFEMLHKSKVAEGPAPADADGAGMYSTRITRSQARRQQRIDSIESPTEVKDHAFSNCHLAPPGTAIANDKPAPSTPPPHASLLSLRVEPKSPDKIAITPGPSNVPVARSAQESVKVGNSNVVVKSSGRSLPDPLLSPLPLNIVHQTKLSNSARVGICPTPVVPPNVTKDELLYYVWTSTNSSISRPLEPWLPSKRWACCMCRRLDSNRDAAQTIVEQKVCSRLECGHVRCRAGCKVAIGAAFVGY